MTTPWLFFRFSGCLWSFIVFGAGCLHFYHGTAFSIFVKHLAEDLLLFPDLVSQCPKVLSDVLGQAVQRGGSRQASILGLKLSNGRTGQP